jgi:hypothetical protein
MNNVTHIVILGQAEELADLCGSLWAESLWVYNVGDAGNIVISLLDNGEGEDGEVHGDDAATNRLALALTGSARAVAGVSIGEEESDTSGMHNTLLHWETLLVVASSDLEDVSLELVANGVSWHFLAHSLLHEYSQLSVIFDLNELLRAIGREGDIQLHLDGVAGSRGWLICRCRLA